MRLVNGLEVLLTKAQEWEEYAAKYVSLAERLSVLSKLVLRWRRLELRSWSGLLRRTEREHEKMALLWWKRLFDVLGSPPDEQQLSNVPPTDGAALSPVTVHLEQAFRLVEQYMQTSTIGQFSTRLSLVRALSSCLRTTCVTTDTTPLVLARVLDNMVAFYSMFLPTLKEHIQVFPSSLFLCMF